MRFPLAPAHAARLIVALSKRAEWKAIHKAADAYLEPSRKAILKAFMKGRDSINQTALKIALTTMNEKKVVTIMSGALEVTEEALRHVLKKMLKQVMLASGTAAAARLPKKKVLALRTLAPEIKGFKFDVTNPQAVEWITSHAGELITGISESTREDIVDLVEAAFEEQFDVDDLADRISELIGDESRAETIARTETMRASNEGQSQLWDQAVEEGLLTGAEKQVWITTPDDRLCPICEPMDGVTTTLDGTFDVDGDEIDGPPAHPNCRCTIGLGV